MSLNKQPEKEYSIFTSGKNGNTLSDTGTKMKILADTKTFKIIDDVAACIYDAASGFPGGDRYGLSSQIRRTAVSMTTSVAESCATVRNEDMLQLLRSACTKLRSLQYLIGSSL